MENNILRTWNGTTPNNVCPTSTYILWEINTRIQPSIFNEYWNLPQLETTGCSPIGGIFKTVAQLIDAFDCRCLDVSAR